MDHRFNEEQEKAIKHGDGPAMVLAGPGSGKTLVITYRIAWLIEQMGIHPSNILVITFTRAAAGEMKKRFQSFPGMDHAPVMFGTFHSIFFMILRYAYHYTGSNIIREEDKRGYIKDIADHLELEIEDENDFLNGIINEISFVKGEMLSLNHYHSTNCSDELFGKIYQEYDDRLRRSGMLDFDDMLVFCYELFKEREDILAMWQRKFQYILIDEFQDINRVQYEIVKMLAGDKKNLFIVGDDDQSIYRFRGAKPEIMLGFERDFANCKKVILNTNYRCSEEIVNAAENLIIHNQKRFPKDMKAQRGSKVPVTYRTFATTTEESMEIIKAIRFYESRNIPLEEMAIIFRTNTQPRILVGRLMEYGIPFQMRDTLPNIFEHWIAKNIIAYLRLASGERDRSLFLSVMNRPKRYISRQMITDPEVDFQHLKKQTFGKKWLYEKIDKLEMDLYLLKKLEPYAAIDYIRNGMGYSEYLVEYAQFRRMQPDDLEEILNQIQETSKDCHTFQEWFDYIESYGEELKKQLSEGRGKEKKGVTLTTMHSAKGLEYKVVFLIDVNETVTPHKKAVKDADLEEERRLFYVAITRAKTYLFVYHVKELFQKEVKPSRYLTEMKVRQGAYVSGKRVKHERFGEGVIMEVADEKITVLFDKDHRKRRFSYTYVIENNLLQSISSPDQRQR